MSRFKKRILLLFLLAFLAVGCHATSSRTSVALGLSYSNYDAPPPLYVHYPYYLNYPYYYVPDPFFYPYLYYPYPLLVYRPPRVSFFMGTGFGFGFGTGTVLIDGRRPLHGGRPLRGGRGSLR